MTFTKEALVTSICPVSWTRCRKLSTIQWPERFFALIMYILFQLRLMMVNIVKNSWQITSSKIRPTLGELIWPLWTCNEGAITVYQATTHFESNSRWDVCNFHTIPWIITVSFLTSFYVCKFITIYYFLLCRYCGLSRAYHWNDLAGSFTNDTLQRYIHTYATPDDIDLWSAGISERPTPGSMVGPVFGCIMGETFKNLRYGDRFWYENGGWPSSFTLGTFSSSQFVIRQIVITN